MPAPASRGLLITSGTAAKVVAPIAPAASPIAIRKARICQVSLIWKGSRRVSASGHGTRHARAACLHELPVHEAHQADAGSEGQQEDDAGLPAGPVFDLGHTPCVGVVEQHHRPAMSRPCIYPTGAQSKRGPDWSPL